MTEIPDELVDATTAAILAKEDPTDDWSYRFHDDGTLGARSMARDVLDLIPDGWARVEGKWVHLDPQGCAEMAVELRAPVVTFNSPEAERLADKLRPLYQPKGDNRG